MSGVLSQLINQLKSTNTIAKPPPLASANINLLNEQKKKTIIFKNKLYNYNINIFTPIENKLKAAVEAINKSQKNLSTIVNKVWYDKNFTSIGYLSDKNIDIKQFKNYEAFFFEWVNASIENYEYVKKLYQVRLEYSEISKIFAQMKIDYYDSLILEYKLQNTYNNANSIIKKLEEDIKTNQQLLKTLAVTNEKELIVENQITIDIYKKALENGLIFIEKEIIIIINGIDKLLLPLLNNEYILPSIDINNNNNKNNIINNLNDIYLTIKELLKTNQSLINLNNKEINSGKNTLNKINTLINSFDLKYTILSKEQVGKKLTLLMSLFVDIKIEIDLYNKKQNNISLENIELVKLTVKYDNQPLNTKLAEFFENNDSNKNIKLFLLIVLIIIIILVLINSKEICVM